MKTLSLRALFLTAAMLTVVQIPALKAQELQDVELKDIWVQYKFYSPPAAQIRWMQDDNYYSALGRDNTLKKIAVNDPSDETVLIPGDKMKHEGAPLDVSSYKFNADETKVLLLTDRKKIYRHSAKYRAFVYDLKAQSLVPVFNAELIMLPTFSPDGSKIGFVNENDLYFEPVGGKPTRITNDGKWNHIINGATDWVYEEEFAFTQGFHWSKDGKKIAFLKFDESNVKQFNMFTYGELYPGEYKFKYPKAGEDNAVVSLHIYDLQTKKTLDAKLQPEEGGEFYIPRIKWTQDPNILAVMQMNRLQNRNRLLFVDGITGESDVVLTETSDAYVTEVSDKTWTFLESGDQFIWMTDRDGYNHLYLYDMQGKLLNQITQGEWEVTKFYGLDEKNNTLYYQSTEGNHLQRGVFAIGLDGKKKTELTKEDGWNEASFSSGFSYFIHTYSAADIPPKTTLRKADGEEIRVLQDNADKLALLEKYRLSKKEFFDFKTENGDKLYGWMIKPHDFKKRDEHPLLMFTYGGPGNQQVTDKYDPFNYFWYQMLAAQGYVIACVDGRGTGGRGAKFKKSTYMQLGKFEAEDQIAAAKYLGDQAYVDKNRIGIWGWSFGGYLSSLALFKGEGVFDMAIAVAPVTNWRFYDTIYTERYMRTPQENAEGYDNNSPINFVDKMEGDYLLIHGMADDNVHFQNAVELSDALINANKEFDMFYYPNRDHGIAGGVTRYHLYNKMTNYILEHL